MDGLIVLQDDANEDYSSALNEILCGMVAISLDHCNQDNEANHQSANYLRYPAVIEYVRNNLSDPRFVNKKLSVIPMTGDSTTCLNLSAHSGRNTASRPGMTASRPAPTAAP